jgi:AraC-like DNA-binding protein
MDARPTSLGKKTRGALKIRNLSAAPEVVLALGGDFSQVLATTGLEQNLFSNPDNVISYLTLGRLLRECVSATNCEHFGLLVGMRQSISVLGLAGYVAANSPTVGDALEIIIATLKLSDTGGALRLCGEKGFASLFWTVTEPGVEAREQIDDAATAIACNVMRQLCGPDWRPTEVCLPRPRPKDPRPYFKFFDAPVRFEADQACVIFDERHLVREIDGRDAALHMILSPLLDKEISSAKRSVRDDVADILRAQPPGETLTPDRAASALGISPRTLSRRLAAENATFSEIAQLVRFEAAERLLRTEKSLSEIAEALGYSDATAFIRAFKQFAGTTPARWRRDQRA